MWRFACQIVVCLLAGGAWAQESPAPERITAIDVRDLSAFIDGFVQARMLDRGVVGVTVSVVQGGERIVSKGYGYDDLTARRTVDPARSLFRPGSISKTLTWTAVMQLVERDLLDLEADVQSYLPNVEIAPTFTKPITMLDLMAHQPGFEDTALGHLFVGRAEQVLPLETYLNTHQPERIWEPGTVPAYSNYGTALAGQIVANLSGMPFEDYIERHITHPLGMHNTTYREPWGKARPGSMPDELLANVSKGYIKMGADYEHTDFAFIGQIGPAGALSTTADDMATWMLTHLGEGALEDARILAADTARKMHTQHRQLHPKLPGLAHGFIESDQHGYRAYGHGGGTVHFLSDLVIVPDLDLGVFISTNTTIEGGRLIANIASEIIKRYYPPGPNILSVIPVADPESAQRSVVGPYILSRRAFSTVEKMNLPVIPVMPGKNGRIALALGPESFVSYEPVGDDVYQSVRDPDQKIAFREGADGTTDAFYLSAPIVVAERAGVTNQPQVLFGALMVGAVVFFCVLVGAWLRRKNTVTQASGERWAAVAVYVMAAAWLAAMGCIGVSFARITGDIRRVFFDFPSNLFVSGLTLAVVATVVTFVAVVLLYPVWSTRSWPLWRRLRHGFVVFAGVTVVVVLNHVNAIGFHYF